MSIKPDTRAPFRRGAEAAAGVADDYNGSSAHKFRLGDCILGKLNLRDGKPRRNKHKIASKSETARDCANEWVRGYATALAEMHRRLLGGADSSGVVFCTRAAGITLKLCRAAAVSAYDLKELKRAGVK